MNENTNITCPVYFENHEFGGHLYSIENFTNINFGNVRTTIINNKPYFSAIDLCRGLLINTNKVSQMVIEASQDIINSYYNEAPNLRSGGPLGYDLYYYLDVEMSNTNQYGSEFKQIVKSIFVSESMMFMFMFKSRKREAIKFKAWLAVEILPNMRLIGPEKSVQLISQEANSIADELEDINNQYNNIESNTVKILEKQDMDTQLIRYEMNDIRSRIDLLAGMIGTTITDDYILNDKVTAIASGLNTIFNR